jgi:hypothetical protein
VKNSVNSKPEVKVNSMPLLGLGPMTFGTPMHRSEYTAAKSYPKMACLRPAEYDATFTLTTIE